MFYGGEMRSVNLDSIQDFSQIPAQKVEQNFGAKESPQKDFFSMISENLNKLGETNSYESAGKDSASVQREKNLEQNSANQKEISEKPDTSEKKISDSGEKLANAENKGREKRTSNSEEKKPSREKNLKTDELLQGAIFAEGYGAKNSSAKKTEKVEGRKVVRAENEKKSHNDFDLLAKNVSGTSAEKSDLENLRVGLAKKNFLSETSSAREKDALDENSESEIISSLPLASSQIQNAASASLASATKGAEDFSQANAVSAKSKKEAKIGIIEVKDLRTNVEGAQADAKDLKKDFVRAVQSEQNGGGIELTMDLASNSEKNILSLDSQSAAADGSTFQAMLKNQITQNAGEFVRAGNIVLRDNDSGTINLVLHPESLGNVKIGLELSGKTVMGHIIVASREAFNAFGDGADVLRNAFIQSGFEDAKFDVSFAGSEMQFAQQNRGGQEDDSAMRQGKKIYGEFVEENISVGFENADKNIGNVLASNYSIDVVA